MKGRSRSVLFLMEQLVVITVFAICAAVCVKILFVAHAKTVDAVDTRYAIIIAENAAERFKASDNELCGFTAFYDDDWRVAEEGLASFILLGNIRETEPVTFIDISVERLIDSKELISITAARRNSR